MFTSHAILNCHLWRLLIFVGVVLLIGLLPLPGWLRPVIIAGGFGTNNLLGILLGVIAAASSFCATMRHK
jgi:hypothetical protein